MASNTKVKISGDVQFDGMGGAHIFLMPSSIQSSNATGAASGTPIITPTGSEIVAKIRAGVLETHATKKDITPREVSSYIGSVLNRRMFRAGWNDDAMDVVVQWLRAPKGKRKY